VEEKMNERIQELAEQAGITTNLETDYYEKDLGKWVDYYSEKFAELIVRECADVIHKRIGAKSALDVLEHFGVE
jgi:hypothetical protein